MSSFLTPIRVEWLDGRNWRVLEPFRYHVGTLQSDDIIEVPAGFETDFASIPRVLWAVYPPTGKWAAAALVHDYLYRTGARPRDEADAIFLEAMEVLGVPWARRHLMYSAVRAFGWASYKGSGAFAG